jgi:hypothetical protein
MSKSCINCGSTENLTPIEFGWNICKSCEDSGNEMAKLLENGLTLGYDDGTKEVLYGHFGVEE